MRPFDLKTALFAAAAVCAAAAANAAGLDQFIGFGDSTMDSGYFRYRFDRRLVTLGAGDAAIDERFNRSRGRRERRFAGPGRGRYHTAGGANSASARAVHVGGGGGTNYANGSAQPVATFATDGTEAFSNNVPIVAQISNYLAAVHGVADPQCSLHDQHRRQ